MSTEAQITANRENAKLSTGPQTPAGKQVSSQNALRHGLAARGLIVLPGLEPVFQELEHGLRRSLQPKDTLQETLFKSILEAAWNLERCRQAIAKLHHADETIDPMTHPEYALIQRYHRQADSALHRNLKALGKLQTDNQFRHEAFPLTPEQIEDIDKFEQSPHALSEVCDFQKVVAGSSAVHRAAKANLRNEAKSELAVLHAMFSTPKLSPETQAELDRRLGKKERTTKAAA
jgi:hypothetical protein